MSEQVEQATAAPGEKRAPSWGQFEPGMKIPSPWGEIAVNQVTTHSDGRITIDGALTGRP